MGDVTITIGAVAVRGGLSILLVAALVGVASPATADTTPEPVGACYVDVVTGASGCYESQSELAAALSRQGTQLVVGQPTSSDAVSKKGLPVAPQWDSAIAPRASYLLANVYENTTSGGASLAFTSPYSSLCASYSYTTNVMPAGWDNRVSSFQGYGGCKVKIYEAPNLGVGATYGPIPYAATVGAMNDQTSSLWITG